MQALGTKAESRASHRRTGETLHETIGLRKQWKMADRMFHISKIICNLDNHDIIKTHRWTHTTQNDSWLNSSLQFNVQLICFRNFESLLILSCLLSCFVRSCRTQGFWAPLGRGLSDHGQVQYLRVSNLVVNSHTSAFTESRKAFKVHYQKVGIFHDAVPQ